ncbi:hypothetical protein FGB62_165g013 [Gracilaria domingensis]|nr:hypothetical protein FGB62_165g013 [Gracilaria domingensis]
MRASLLLPIFLLCIGALAHPYPYRRSGADPAVPVSHNQVGPHDQPTDFSSTDAHSSHANANDSHTSPHLRVSHSPMPATIGGGRTLPSSAFYALKFKLSNNSSQRNAAKRNSTTSNSSSVSQDSPSATVDQGSLPNHSGPSSTSAEGSSAFSSHDRTSQKIIESPKTDVRATSLKEKAGDLLSALGLSGLRQLVSSMASSKRTNMNTSVSNEENAPVSGENERVENMTIPPDNISVRVAENISLSDVLEIIMREAEKETDAIAAAPQNETLVSRSTSQLSLKKSSSPLNSTSDEKDEESKRKSEAKKIEGNGTRHAMSSSHELDVKVPHKAIEIIQKLHVLVHLVNQTSSEEKKDSRSERLHPNMSRSKQPDELVQLAKRYVMNLYRTMFLEGTNIEHPRGNGTIAVKSLPANTRVSRDVEGVDTEDNEDSENGNGGTGSPWGEKQDTQTNPISSAQDSSAPNNEWEERQDTPTQPARSSPIQVSSDESAEDIRLGSTGEDPGTEPSDGNPWYSSIVAPPTPKASETMGSSSADTGQGNTDGPRDTEMDPSTPAPPSPSTNPAVEGGNLASSDQDVGTVTSSPSPSTSPDSIPPMAVPMTAETRTIAQPEKNYAVRDGENVTQLADMVYKLVREEEVFSMAVAPCDEVTDWMPNVVRRLREELVELQFYCIDTRMPAQDISPLKRVFGDLATGFVQVGADDIKESIPAELDMVVSWKGLQRWGMERGWHFLRGLRERGTKFVLVSNNPGIINTEDSERAVNVRGSPLLFGEPRRVIGGVTKDNSVQLLLYAMGDIRDGF